MSVSINEHNNFFRKDVSEMLKSLEKRNDENCKIKLFQELSTMKETKTLTNDSFYHNDIEINQKWTFCDISMLKPPIYWKNLFLNNIEMLNDIDFVIKRDKLEDDFIVPLKKDIFKCFDLCKPEDVKVIIFSSKPYTSMCPVSKKPLATGIPFSVPEGSPQPKALSNIVKCVSKMYIKKYNEDKFIFAELFEKYKSISHDVDEKDMKMMIKLYERYVDEDSKILDTIEILECINDNMEINEIMKILSKFNNKDLINTYSSTGLNHAFIKCKWYYEKLEKCYCQFQNKYEEFQNVNIDNINDLSNWYSEGVFMIDSCLTSCIMSKKSHGIMWHGFLLKMIDYIESHSQHEIHYVFWGNDAQQLKSNIKSTLVYEYCHPFMSNFRNNFQNCDNFENINESIENEYEKIKWDKIFF